MNPSYTRVKRVLQRVGDVQSRVIVTLLYILFLPLGLLVRALSGDPLGRRLPPGGNWRARPPSVPSLDDVRRQY